MKWSSKYMKSFYMGIDEAMQYRTNFMLGIVSIVFPITIQIFIWNAVYMNDHEKLVYGFSYSQMIVYTLLSAIVSKFIASEGFEWEVNDDIKNGGLNKYLIKPIGYFEYRISCCMGKKTPQSIIIFILIVTILLISNIYLGQAIVISRIVSFFVSIVLATLLNILIVYCVSTVAFWISDAGSFFTISYLVVNIFSGGVFPMEIFGDKLNRIFNALPFKYTIYYPVTIINGKLDQKYIIVVLLLQVFWIIVLKKTAEALWNFGMKNYTAIGG